MQVPQTENYTEFGKGTLIGSGADFAAGAAGSLLEQAISGECVNAGRGILGGLSNAVSGAIFGNVPFKNAGQAFGKGALAGAATSGLGYLSDLAGRQPKSGQMRHFPGGAVTRTPYERLMDPRGICILQDVFGGGLGVRKAYGYRYEMRDPDQPERNGFDLGDFLRSTLTGGLMGGLTGVAFFGVGKAVGALKGSLSGREYRKNSDTITELTNYYPSNNGSVSGTQYNIHLMTGEEIDRYGRLSGKYFSPVGTPLEMRALPHDADLTQYRVFEVIKPFEVEASTIAPAFGKIGLGIQYRSNVSAEVLLKKGIIKSIEVR